jgi:hypothetical protein
MTYGFFEPDNRRRSSPKAPDHVIVQSEQVLEVVESQSGLAEQFAARETSVT